MTYTVVLSTSSSFSNTHAALRTDFPTGRHYMSILGWFYVLQLNLSVTNWIYLTNKHTVIYITFAPNVQTAVIHPCRVLAPTHTRIGPPPHLLLQLPLQTVIPDCYHIPTRPTRSASQLIIQAPLTAADRSFNCFRRECVHEQTPLLRAALWPSSF